MKKKMVLSQRIHNAVGSQKIENLHAMHEYLHAKAFSAEEWGVFWSRSEEVSWAHEFGRIRGFDKVYFTSVTDYDAGCYETYLDLYEEHPEVGGKDPRPLPEIAFHALATDIVEVAQDGKSARAYFYTPGFICNNLTYKKNPQKKLAPCWERYGADFVYENGEWLFLHEQVCPDIISSTMDTINPAREKYLKMIDPNAEPERPRGGPPVDDPGPLHLDYSPTNVVQNTVPWPTPYVTLDENNTYTKKREGD